MRTWSLSLARGAVVPALSVAFLAAAPAGAQTSDEERDDTRTRIEKALLEVRENIRARAEQGDAKAQFDLGVRYADGEGVPQDYVQAHKWFNLAASSAGAAFREAFVEQPVVEPRGAPRAARRPADKA